MIFSPQFAQSNSMRKTIPRCAAWRKGEYIGDYLPGDESRGLIFITRRASPSAKWPGCRQTVVLRLRPEAEAVADVVGEPREEAHIRARLEEVLDSIFCPVGACWCLHGCNYEYYCDEGCECYVLEVRPVGFEEPEEVGGNGRKKHEGNTCYEFAEFEFGEMVKEVPLERLHFSQRRRILEIGWKDEAKRKRK